MPISKAALEDFENRELDSFDWMKLESAKALDKALAELDPAPDFHTKPFLHQKACFLIGVYEPAFMWFLDMGLGKAQPLSSGVLTPTGYVPMGNLKRGDTLCHPTKKTSKIIDIYPQGKKDIFLVTFNDGSSTRCCGEHLWQVHNAFNVCPTSRDFGKSPQVLSTLELRKTIKRKNGNSNHFIPITDPVYLESSGELPLDPYLLGLLLGDGYLGKHSVSLSTGDVEILKSVEKVLPPLVKIKQSNKYDYRLSVERGQKNVLVKKLRSLDLLGKKSRTKFIPNMFMHTSIENRISILQGLFDTDGYISKKGTTQYTSMSPHLLNGATFLLESLGAIVRKTSYHTITVRPPEWLKLFRLERKLKRIPKKTKYKPSRAIKTIEPDGAEECQCIKIDRDDGLYLTDRFIVTHNTKLILDLIAYAKKRETRCQTRALILVPNLVDLYTWENEWKIHRPDLKFLVLDGSTEERWARLRDPVDFDAAVLNYAGFTHLVCKIVQVYNKKKRKMVNEMAVDPSLMREVCKLFTFTSYDESTILKNHQSLIYNACKGLSRACQYRYALTGTPFGRDPSDLWAQFYVIDFGDTLGPTLGLYREAFCTSKINYWSGWPEYSFDKRKKNKFSEVIQHRSIVYSSEECQDLPPQIFKKIVIPWAKEQRSYYDKVLDGYKLQAGNKKALEASFINLRCICSGFLMFKVPGSKKRTEISFKENPKIEAMLELVREMPYNSKMIIYHEYTHTGHMIEQALQKEKIACVRLYGGTKDKKGAIETFKNEKSCWVLVVNNASGSKSLNLQVANYTIYFEGPVSPINRQQSQKRTSRTGQEKTTYYYDLIMKSGVDWQILSYLKEGRDLMRDIIHGRAMPE